MDDMSWMDGLQSPKEQVIALVAELAYHRTDCLRQVVQDEDGVYEITGDVFASRNLTDIIARLEALIEREESKTKERQLPGLSGWERKPKCGRGKKSIPKPALPPAVMRSPQIALSMSMTAITRQYTVGSKWQVVDTEVSIHNGIWTITKSMPKTLVLLNEYGEWKFTFPSELLIIDAKPGYLEYNISNGGTVTMVKKEA